MGFSRRCEAIKAPTTENDPIRVARATIERTGGHEDLAQGAPVDEAEDQAGRGQRYAQSTQRPSQPGGAAGAHPTVSSPPFSRPLFTQVRGRRILRSSDTGSCIAPVL